MKLNKTPLKKNKAQAMVEFAIVLPILLLVLYGLLETGRLLFMYSTIVNATRQASRYGSATGAGTGGVPRYQDCAGIRLAAQKVDFLNSFNDDDIFITYDDGPGTSGTYPPSASVPPWRDICDGTADTDVAPAADNTSRIVVKINGDFLPIVKLVPFFERSVANNNPIEGVSARTILMGVSLTLPKEPTVTLITADTPDPSIVGQPVTVSVTVTSTATTPTTPTGLVDISGADTACQITLVGGSGSCTVVFTAGGVRTLMAFYNGDATHDSSADDEEHTVNLASTFTFITDTPDPSIVGQIVNILVNVSDVYGYFTPTGTVAVSAPGSVPCQITLVNGSGSCNITFNSSGNPPITANYSGDSGHLPSTGTAPHQVLVDTPTPTPTPTRTSTPTVTPTRTITPTPTLTPIPTSGTPVTGCNAIRHGTITNSGNTLTLTINSPVTTPVQIQDVFVVWNHDKGHEVGIKKLTLLTASITSQFWSGNGLGPSQSITPAPAAYIPTGPSTITFTFDQSYDFLDTTERILINLSTPGCTLFPISAP